MGISDNIKLDILQRIDIVSLIGEYVSLKRKGARYWGLCPFHNEKTASFCVTPEKDLYYCFGCHKGGDLFNFVMEIENIGFPDAIRFLADRAGIEITWQDRKSSTGQALRELYEKVCGSFHYILMENQEGEIARNYLEKRGISRSLIESFKIGYAPKNRLWLKNFLQEKGGYSIDFLKGSGLFSLKSGELYPYFLDRVIFPITDARGVTVAFGGRSLSESGPKYMNSPETEIFRKGEILFGLHRAAPEIRKQGSFILVEGYMDVMAAHQAGLINTVAPLGTALTEMQVRILKRYTERGILLFDGDEAGARAARNSIVLLEGLGFNISVADLPEGSDPADFLAKEGIEKLHSIINNAVNSFDYLIAYGFSRNEVSNPEGKSAIFELMLPFLNNTESEVKREAYLNKLADALQVDALSVNRDFIRSRQTLPRRKEVEMEKGKIDITDDLFLMIAITANLDYFSVIRNRISPEDLLDEKARQILYSLEECFRNDTITLDALWEHIEDEELKNIIMERISSDEFTINSNEVMDDAVKKIKQRKDIAKRDDLIRSLKRLKENDPDRKNKENEMLLQIMLLNSQIDNTKVIRDVGLSN
jgi:DNA primase